MPREVYESSFSIEYRVFVTPGTIKPRPPEVRAEVVRHLLGMPCRDEKDLWYLELGRGVSNSGVSVGIG